MSQRKGEERKPVEKKTYRKQDQGVNQENEK